MLKRYIAFISAVFLVIGLAPLKATAATAADYDEVYKYNLVVYGSKHNDKDTLAFYLTPEIWMIESDDADIIALARSVTSGKNSDYSKIKAVHDWVANNMWYDAASNRTFTSTSMLSSKRGACWGYANLTAALIRAAGIPAKTVKGFALNTGRGFFDISNKEPDHAWNEAYADGRWIILDATWDSQNKYTNGVPSAKKACKSDFFDISLKELSKDHRYLEYTDYRFKDGMVIDIDTNELIIIHLSYRDTVTDVIVPDGVTGIQTSAFNGCSNLTSVFIPGSVTSLGDDVFAFCPKLSRVVVPKSVISIGFMAFGDLGNNPNLVLYGSAGSYVEAYAKEQWFPIPFVAELPSDINTKTSPWADTQVNAAIAVGLVPESMQINYTQSASRAEFCALAVALYEKYLGKEVTGRVKFVDTSDVNVEKMAYVGVVTGVGNNKFAPSQQLSREQAAVLLTNLAKAIEKPLPKATANFADSGSISPWALTQVGQIQNAGIMSGSGNRFDPKSPYTREQSIITMLRLWDAVKSL